MTVLLKPCASCKHLFFFGLCVIGPLFHLFQMWEQWKSPSERNRERWEWCEWWMGTEWVMEKNFSK